MASMTEQPGARFTIVTSNHYSSQQFNPNQQMNISIMLNQAMHYTIKAIKGRISNERG